MLLVRFRVSSDPQAFEELFRRSAPRIERLARRLGIDAGGREDFVQDVFLSVLSEVDRFDGEHAFSAWAAGIAWRKALAERRRFLQRRVPHGVLVQRGVTAPLEEVERSELRAAVAESVRRLPALHCEVVRLYYLEELPVDEIARRTGRPPSTIRTQIARGLARLRAILPAGVTPGLLLLLRFEVVPRPAGAPPPAAGSGMLTGHAVLSALAAGGLVLLARMSWTEARHEPVAAVHPALARVAPTAEAWLDVPPPELARSALSPSSAAAGVPSLPKDPPAAAKALAEPARLRVRLVDQKTNEPVPDFVFAWQVWNGGPPARVVQDGAEPKPAVDLGAGSSRARTDSSGEALLEVPRGPLRLRFTPADGSSVFDVESDEEITLPVGPVATLTGWVVDERGAPVAGAEVWCDEVVHGSFQRSFAASTTTADGSFRFRIQASSAKKLWALLPGRSRSPVLVVPTVPLPTEALRLQLGPASATTTGTVLRPDGTPCPGALVTLSDTARDPVDRAPVQHATDDEGRFTFDTLLPQVHELLAVDADGASARTRIDLTWSHEATCDLVLTPGAEIHGRARTPDGAPAAGTLVAALPIGDGEDRWELWRLTHADADGRFDLASVPPGPIELLLIDPRHADVLARARARATPDLSLEWNPISEPHDAVSQHNALRRVLTWQRDPGAPRPEPDPATLRLGDR